MNDQVDIIGGGIGGITAAIALKRNGAKVRVFEQAPAIKPVGAGIVLASNAMQVYEKLGIRPEIEEAGNAISSMNITRPDLKGLSEVHLEDFERKHGVKNVAIHRGALHQILVNKLNKDELILNKKLAAIEKKNGYVLKFTDGTDAQSRFVLGADGIYSAVRGFLLPDAEIRKPRQVCWRGITDYQLPERFDHGATEAWGKGDRFGFVQIAPGKVYWYALKTYRDSPSEYRLNDIPDYFRNYDPVIRDIIRSTDLKTVFTDEISDLKPVSSWFKGNVCLLGDAAHATTPNLGQGACQAVVDAWVLSECLHKYPLNSALEKFQQLRIKKTHNVVRFSWLTGRLAHLQNPAGVAARNIIMKLTPVSVNKKQLESLFELEKVS